MNYWNENDDEMTDSQVFHAVEEEEMVLWEEEDEQLLCNVLDDAEAAQNEAAAAEQAETTQLVDSMSQLDLWQDYHNAVEVPHMNEEPTLTQMIRDVQQNSEPTLSQMIRNVEPQQSPIDVAVDWWEQPAEQPAKQPAEDNNRPINETTRRALQLLLAKRLGKPMSK